MEYTNHIMKAADASELQAAIEGGELVSPYVALNQDTGEIFYDNFVPDEPEEQYLGVWSDDGEGTYTFQILDTGDTTWMDGVSIAQLFDLYPDGDGPYDMDVILSLSIGEPSIWVMEFHVDEQSDMPQNDFYEGSQDLWNSGAMVDPNVSNSSVDVEWDGVDTFTFRAADLNISTINPPYPEPEGE